MIKINTDKNSQVYTTQNNVLALDVYSSIAKCAACSSCSACIFFSPAVFLLGIITSTIYNGQT